MPFNFNFTSPFKRSTDTSNDQKVTSSSTGIPVSPSTATLSNVMKEDPLAPPVFGHSLRRTATWSSGTFTPHTISHATSSMDLSQYNKAEEGGNAPFAQRRLSEIPVKRHEVESMLIV